MKEDNSNTMNNKINKRSIFGLVDSVTREQALAMLKANEDKRMASSTDVVANKNQAEDKRANDVTVLVTTVSEIMKRLEQLGPSKLSRLHIDKLHALIVNTDPQDSVPKLNKKYSKRKPTSCPLFKPLSDDILR